MAAGSVLGGFARYWLAGGIYRVAGSGFPYGTLAVNISGCLLMGALNVVAQERMLLTHEVRIFLMTGFCGAFTTFSTFILETSELMKAGETLRAAANVAGSAGLGFLFFKLGEELGRI